MRARIGAGTSSKPGGPDGAGPPPKPWMARIGIGPVGTFGAALGGPSGSESATVAAAAAASRDNSTCMKELPGRPTNTARGEFYLKFGALQTLGAAGMA